MPRLLIVVNIPRFFVSHRLPLALAARRAGYEVHVASSEASGGQHDSASLARIRAEGLPFHALPLAQHGTNPLDEGRLLATFIGLYRRLQPDLLHHVSLKPVLYGGLAARLLGLPSVGAMSGLGYVFIGPGWKPRLLRSAIQPALRLALGSSQSRMIFQNADDLARFVALGYIHPQRAALIRGSGVDLERFRPAPAPPDGLPIVLFAGRLMWPKGLGAFVGAARALRGRARFVVVGYAEATSPSAVPIEQLCAWADEGLIEYWGARDDMPAVYAQASVVCLPSTYGEGVPKVLIEAAACGLPLLTTDTPGCRDICRHESSGLLVPPHDQQALNAALLRLLDDPALRARLGTGARTLAEAEFGQERIISQTLALYAALLGADPEQV
ncbi:MAG: glycosyltransferase family 4 protein [Anaerolineae bacterium]|nr:glycosyltransferase family 4 protein [Anaerolineae bacterium]MDW8172941.1 glycosyltransferase family 4 protein [Anaerolineae bacterium]